MNRKQQEQYYDDENMMEIVDYSQPRRGEDLNNPNASNGVALPSSPVHRTEQIIDESIYITERLGPILLSKDEQLDVLNLIEGGELISIEVVTDNPYASVYLELDDFKNRTPTGITAAELLMKGRTGRAERQFYAESRRPDGSYVLKYEPAIPHPYTARIKLQVRNDIKETGDLFGWPNNQAYTTRGNLPVPQYISFSGGGFIKNANIRATKSQETGKSLLRFNAEEYDSGILNLAHVTNNSLTAGTSHPYVGMAGEVVLGAALDLPVSGLRIVTGAVGEKLLSETGFPTPNTEQWPGNAASATPVPSQQQVLIYLDATENSALADAALKSTFFFPADTPGSNQKMFIKQGDSIYFLGKLMTLHFYDAVTSQWQLSDPEGHTHQANTDGALCLTFSPGVPVKPDKITTTTATEIDRIDTLGEVNPPNEQSIITGSSKGGTARIRVREIIVIRKRKKTLLL